MNGVPTGGIGVLNCPNRDDEWLPWTEYVYLWACNIPGGMRVKVGMTNNPDRRATEFRTNSPFPVHRHLICQCPDRAAAYELEQSILAAFAAWRVRGEWVRVEAKRLDRFIAACTAIARREVSPVVRFRDHRPRQPNGDHFGKRYRRRR